MRARTFVLLFLVPCIGGCLDHPPVRDSSEPTSPPGGRQSEISIQVEGPNPSSIRKAVSLDFSDDVTATINFTATGPKWKGVTVLQYSVADPTTYAFHAYTWGRHEYAKTLQINELTGQRLATCLGNQTPDGQCEIFGGQFGQYKPSIVNDPATIWLKGKTRLIIDGEFQGLFSLNISFSRPVIVGPAEDIALNATRVAPDLLDARFMDIARCLSVGFCGTIVGGSMTLSIPDGYLGYLWLQGHSDPAAFLNACVNGAQPGPSSGCIVGQAFVGFGYLGTFVAFGDTTVALDASGAPFVSGVNDGLSSFYLGGRMTAFPR
jgi:hypothetical protein